MDYNFFLSMPLAQPPPPPPPAPSNSCSSYITCYTCNWPLIRKCLYTFLLHIPQFILLICHPQCNVCWHLYNLSERSDWWRGSTNSYVLSLHDGLAGSRHQFTHLMLYVHLSLIWNVKASLHSTEVLVFGMPETQWLLLCRWSVIQVNWPCISGQKSE
jgi:hypothetical protein